MLERHIGPLVSAALRRSQAVVLTGPRRCGKAVLAESLADNEEPRRVYNLSSSVVLAAIRQEPRAFIQAAPSPALLLHAHRSPGLLDFLAGDRTRTDRPGRLLLTSATRLSGRWREPSATSSLDVLRMWPLSQGELGGHREGFLTRLLCHDQLPPEAPQIELRRLWHIITRGGFPEAVNLAHFDHRMMWFDGYLDLTVNATRAESSSTDGFHNLPPILADLAASSAGLVAKERLRRAALVFVGGSATRWRRVKRFLLRRTHRPIPAGRRAHYTDVLESLLLVDRLPGWPGSSQRSECLDARFQVTDSGLLCHLLDLPETPAADPRLLDAVTFSFVAGELRRQASWNESTIRLSYYCPRQSPHPVLVVEEPEGVCAGIVVKPHRVDRSCVSGLREFADAAGSRFIRGVVLCCGAEVVPFARGFKAVPLSAIWEW